MTENLKVMKIFTEIEYPSGKLDRMKNIKINKN